MSWSFARACAALHSLSGERARRWFQREGATGLVFGTAVGLMFLMVRPRAAFAVVAALLLVLMTFTHPELVILVVLCFASGLIPAAFDPSVELLVGRFRVSELVLLWLLLFIPLKVLSDRSFRVLRSPLNLPLLLFATAVLIGLLIAVWRYGIAFSNGVYEARQLMYYLIFFPIVNLVRTRPQIVRLSQGLCVVGLLLAIAMLGQSAFGAAGADMAHAPARGGPVRVFMNGATCVYVACIILMCHMALEEPARHSPWRWLQVSLMAAALSTGLARNLLVQLAVMGIALLVILPLPAMARLGRNLLGTACVTLGLALATILAGKGPTLLSYARVYLERLDRMFSPQIVATTETVAPRWVEIRFAWQQLSAHPVVGIGLYHPYRPRLWAEEPIGRTMFLHNAYLSLWLKTGLLGLLSFIWLSSVYLARGIRYWRTVEDVFLRAVVLGLTLAYFTVMLSNMVAPSFLQGGSLPVFGVALGLGECILLRVGSAPGSRERGIA